jgi:outer membrane usher protein FimD/PapC
MQLQSQIKKFKFTENKFNRYKLNTIISIIFGLLFSLSVHAIEIGGQLHQGNESDTQGLSLVVSDSFKKGGNFHWTLGYSTLDDVLIEWNDKDYFLQLDTIDAIVTYRLRPKTYNSFLKHVTFDFQAGASMVLSDSELNFNLNANEYSVLIAEQNDINAIFGLAANYKVNRNLSINLGLKHQPSPSKFDDISSVYLGVMYRFGNGFGY